MKYSSKNPSAISQKRSHETILILAIFCTIMAGCNQPFEPMQENEQHFFSIFGYLDASRDTQLVRLLPLRNAINHLPEIDDVIVRLSHPESGEQVIMKDSLYQFREASTYNYWTDMKIEPGERYRLSATHSDGRESQATVTLPPDFPEPRVSGDSVWIVENVERLADVSLIYHLSFNFRQNDEEESIRYKIPYLIRSNQFDSTSHRIFLTPENDRETMRHLYCNAFMEGIWIVNREIFIASAGPEWVDFLSYDEEIETLPDLLTNIENGTGFLAGIVSKTAPYRGQGNSYIECDPD